MTWIVYFLNVRLRMCVQKGTEMELSLDVISV